jgi:hypothetical protein
VLQPILFYASRVIPPRDGTHGTPSTARTIGSSAQLAQPLLILAVVFAIGFWVFNRSAGPIAENL